MSVTARWGEDASVDLVALRAAMDAAGRDATRWVDRRCDGCGRRVASRGVVGLVKCTSCQPGDVPVTNAGLLRSIDIDRQMVDVYQAALDSGDGWVRFGAWESCSDGCALETMAHVVALIAGRYLPARTHGGTDAAPQPL